MAKKQILGSLLLIVFCLGGGFAGGFFFPQTELHCPRCEKPGDFILTSTAEDYEYDGNFTLEWTASQGSEKYAIYSSLLAITEINSSVEIEGFTFDLEWRVIGKSPGDYIFIIEGINGTGSTLSNQLTIEVDEYIPIPPGAFVLTVPGTDNDGNFQINWTNASGAEIYSVYSYGYPIVEINSSHTLEGSTIGNFTAISGKSNGIYYFVVTATNGDGSTLSNQGIVEVSIPPPPGPFTIIDAGTYLWWTSSSGANLYVAYSFDSPIVEINGSLTFIGSTTYTDIGLFSHNEGWFYFIVNAINEYGSTLSNCFYGEATPP